MFVGVRYCMLGRMRDGSVSRMFPVAFLAVVSIFCAMSAAQEVSSDERGLAALQAVSSSNLKFTNSIYKILSQKEGNVFFSPISIEVILALTYMGAKGVTASQMSKGLELPSDNELTKEGFNALINSLKSDENITLNIANKIFTDNAVPLKSEFQSIAQKTFVSDVEAVDFKNNYEAARVQINQWVEGKTNKKITDLIAQGLITAETALVLVNAVYFKGDWALKFDAAHTKTEPFFVTPTQTKDVQMMHVKKKFGFTVSDELDCKVLELPYKGDKLSLVVLLPNELDGLAKLEAKLPSVDLKQLLGSLGKPEVDVSLPKFKLEQFIDLNDVLKKLGMVNMFEDSADFSGLTDTEVKVSKVVHKAFIEVNEEGSEAAAATAAVVRLKRSLPPPPVNFVGDHPFTLFIYDRLTEHVLFAGRLGQPQPVHARKETRDEL